MEHGARCAQEPGYLLRGRPGPVASTSRGRYGWGLSWLGLPSEDVEPAEGAAEEAADAGLGRGGWPLDGLERVTYDAEDGEV